MPKRILYRWFSTGMTPAIGIMIEKIPQKVQITGNASGSQPFQGQAAGVDDFHPVRKDMGLEVAGLALIPVAHGVEQGHA